MKIHNLLVLALILTLTLNFGGATATAQGTASRVTGVVLDANGAAIEGATVILTNEGTNISLTTQSSSTGTYTFDSVQVGTYTVSVEMQGFKKAVSTGNPVNVNQPATVNVMLEAGAVAETVTVQGSAELVQTSTSGNFGNTVEERPLAALPIVGNRGRNPLTFILFQPGVVEGANTGGGVHVHGARDRAFNFTLDGIDANDTTAGGSNFTPIRTNPDSLTQFQVITSNFTADNGRSSGAQVNLVTKSGTNEFHGNVFEFYQTPRFHANEYANTINTRVVNGERVATDRPQFVQHIFGGSVGGPVFLPKFGQGGDAVYNGKNRTFFFTNMQFLRTSQAFFVNRTVYTQAARSGNFRYMLGRANANANTTAANTRVIDANGTPFFPNCSATVTTNCVASFSVVGNPNIPLAPDPTTAGLINLMPLPNNFTVGDGLNTAGFSWVAPQTERQYDWTMKVDHNFNESNAVYVRYSRGSQNTLCDNANGGLARFPGLPCFVDTFRTPRNLAVNYRATLAPTVVNEFVAGFNRFTFSFNNPDANWAANSPVILNIPTDPLNSTPGVNNARRATTKQFVDNLSWQKDAHTFKFGTNIRLQDHFDDRSSVASLNTRESVTLGTGDNSVPASFGTTASSLPGATTANPNAGIAGADRSRLDSYINDIFGRVGRVTQAFVAENDSQFGPGGKRFLYTARYSEYDFYAQDTWKARPNLTIDYGMRWEVRLSPRADNLVLRPSTPVRFGEAATNALRFEEGKLYDDSWKQFAPTVGFAWDPFGGGKTSVRGNYRLAWDRTNTFVFSSFIFQNAPGLTRGITLLANGFPGGSAAALLRNGLPTLSANDTTPLAFRTPPAYSVNSISVVDPELTYPRTHQYGVSVQREIGWKSVVEVNYIGRLGRKLFGSYDANQVDLNNNGFLNSFRQLQGRAGACDAATVLNPNFLINQLLVNDSRLQNTTTCGGVSRRETGAEFLIRQATGGNVRLANGQVATNIVDAGSAAQAAFLVTQGFRAGNNATPNFVLNGFSPFLFQPFPQFAGAINVLENNDRSRYNALEVQFSRRYSGGFAFQASYTLAKSEDTRSYDPALTFLGRSAGGTTATFLSANTPFDLRDRDANWAASDFDRRHAIQGYFTLDLPFGRGRRWASGMNPALDHIVGGFELAGIVRWYSGRPFTVYSGIGSVSQVVQSPASCNGCTPDMGGIFLEGGRNFFFTPEQRDMFFAPPAGELGNTGRNFFRGPSLFQLDMTMGKRIRFDEHRHLELRVEAQNLTNTPAFDFPTAVISNSNFGLVGGAVVNTSRKVQRVAIYNFPPAAAPPTLRWARARRPGVTRMDKRLKRAAATAALLVLLVAQLSHVSGARPGDGPVYDLVVRDARVVDGSGNPWFRADVAISGGRIARVGRVAASEGRRVIEARGQVLAPGFIDVHAHVENLFDLPDAENFVRMGVTTLVTGNCGGSAVDVGRWLGRAAETPPAVNVATLVGHNSVRREVFGEQNRAPTPEELGRMKSLVERAMRDGAVGLSTGLIYVPGVYSKTDEVLELARVAALHGGVYATHMRNEGLGVADAIRESIEIGERAGLPVQISHFKLSAKKLWGGSDATLGLVREARRRGLQVTVDQYAYTASSTSLDSRLPEWVLEGGRDEGRKRLADPAQRERVAREMKDGLRKSGFKDFSHAVVASYRPKPEYNGKSIAEVTKLAKGKSDVAGQIEQILEMYAEGGAAMVYHSMGEDDVRRIMREPFTMIASDSGVRRFGEGVPHPRGYGNNARVLGTYVRELRLVTLEDAVRKMTSLPAQTFGLRDRGLVREGMAADLVLFDEAAVSDPSTFEKPHQYAAGFSYVIVNGEPVVEAGRATGARPGRALRHGAGPAATAPAAAGREGAGAARQRLTGADVFGAGTPGLQPAPAAPVAGGEQYSRRARAAPRRGPGRIRFYLDPVLTGEEPPL